MDFATDHPLYIHMKADGAYGVLTPFSDEVLKAKLYVPRRIKTTNTPIQNLTTDFIETATKRKYLGVQAFFTEAEARLRSRGRKFEDDPKVFTVEEYFMFVSDNVYGAGFTVYADKEQHVWILPMQDVDEYCQFIIDGVKPPESRNAFISALPKQEPTIAEDKVKEIVEVLNNLNLPIKFDIYFVQRCGRIDPTVEISPKEQLEHKQMMLIHKSLIKLGNKFGVEIFSFMNETLVVRDITAGILAR